jgi:hypothetical protein
MNKARRSKDVWEEPVANSTTMPGNLTNLLVGRVAQFEIDRFDAAGRARPLPSANGTPLSTESAPPLEVGVDLRDMARLQVLASATSTNATSPKTRPFTFSPTKEWEGYVVAVVSDHVIANIRDLNAGENRVSSTVEIPLKELNARDVARLKRGMIFRWAIGYFRSPSGTKQRHSNIVFRDLPQWSKRELADARKEAAEMAEYFASEKDEPTKEF